MRFAPKLATVALAAVVACMTLLAVPASADEGTGDPMEVIWLAQDFVAGTRCLYWVMSNPLPDPNPQNYYVWFCNPLAP